MARLAKNGELKNEFPSGTTLKAPKVKNKTLAPAENYHSADKRVEFAEESGLMYLNARWRIVSSFKVKGATAEAIRFEVQHYEVFYGEHMEEHYKWEPIANFKMLGDLISYLAQLKEEERITDYQ